MQSSPSRPTASAMWQPLSPMSLPTTRQMPAAITSRESEYSCTRLVIAAGICRVVGSDIGDSGCHIADAVGRDGEDCILCPRVSFDHRYVVDRNTKIVVQDRTHGTRCSQRGAVRIAKIYEEG